MSTITFQTMMPIDLGEASQKEGFPLAGLRGQMLGSVKVTASEESKTYAGVTVSMTSEDSAGYGSMHGGLRTDNLLNRKVESAFVQMADKEKGPAVSQALLPTSVISCTGESNELHHNSHLQATGFAEWQHTSQALGLIPCFFSSLRPSSFSQLLVLILSFCASSSNCLLNSAGIRIGSIGDLPPPFGCLSLDVDMHMPIGLLCLQIGIYTNTYAHIEPTLPHSGNDTVRELTIHVKRTNAMAKPKCNQTRPEFTDTYWIVPCYETTPYGKVSFTRQDRRTFIAMFKDSRLIWAGRKLAQEVAHA